MVYFSGFYAKLGYFAGFSLNIIYTVGRISATAIAGDIIFFCLAGPVGDYTGVHTVFFHGNFSIYYSPELSAKLRSGGGGGGG